MLGVLLSCLAARADITYTTEMMLAGETEGTPKTVTTRNVKPNFERIETTQKIGMVETQTIVIRECGKKLTIQLEPDLKLYSVIPDYNGEGALGAEAGSTPDAEKADADKPATGKMIVTYAVQDLGDATVLNLKTRRFMVDVTTESLGCAGEGTSTEKMEIWASDIRDAAACADENSAAAMSKAMSNGVCKIEVQLKGDFDKMIKISKGLVLRQKMYNGDTAFKTVEVISLSQAKLGNELFTVPADYKKVSAEDFQKAQSEAMTKVMQAGIRIEPDDQ